MRKVVDGPVENGFDVVVLMHSYDGIPDSAALKSLRKTDRVKKTKKGGVQRLMYKCSYALLQREAQSSKEDTKILKASARDAFDEQISRQFTSQL